MPKVVKLLSPSEKAELKAQEFGSWLVRELKKQKISRETLAEWLDISVPAVGYKINGRTPFKLWEVILIFKKLKTEPEVIAYLMEVV